MARPRIHFEAARAVLAEHGEMQAGALAAAIGVSNGTLGSAMRVPEAEGLIVKRGQGRQVFYSLPAEGEAQAVDPEDIRWTIWDDGDLVIYGLEPNTDGSHTIPAKVLDSIKRRIAWSPAQ
jgi:DNA-binding transcriptional ArsR family regulator